MPKEGSETQPGNERNVQSLLRVRAKTTGHALIFSGGAQLAEKSESGNLSYFSSYRAFNDWL